MTVIIGFDSFYIFFDMDLPKELILEISEYANLHCYMCGKKLCPWTMIGYSGIYLCMNECYV